MDSVPLEARIPEPELMDDAEQAMAYAGADFSEVNAGFVERFVASAGRLSGAVLDLGCGPADIAIRLCLAMPDITVTAVDGAAAMLALAESATDDAGFAMRIELVRALVPGSIRDGRRFAAVVSNSLLHHLPDPDALWREIAELAAPGAYVQVMDLRRPVATGDARALVDTYAAGEPEVLRTDFYNSLCAAFTAGEVTSQLARRGLDGQLRVESVSDRHLLVSGRL